MPPGILNVDFSGNTIQDNQTSYDLYMDMSSGNTLKFENNYWGTTDKATILTRIFDFFDSPSKGIVDFEPYLETPGTGIPPMAPLGLTAQATTKISLSWNASPSASATTGHLMMVDGGWTAV